MRTGPALNQGLRTLKRGTERRVKETFERTMYRAGATDRLARRAGGGAVILMYHSITDPELGPWIDPENAMSAELFAAHMRYLAANRNVISMTELQQTLAEGRTPPVGSVVLTFDDGYLDNLTVAAPVLARLELPATFFVLTGHIERTEPQWIDQLYTTFQRRSRHRLRLADLGDAFSDIEPGEVNLRRPLQAKAAYRAIASRMIPMSWQARTELVDDLADRLGTGTPTVPRLTMSWDDVRALDQMSPRFDIGVHTRDHIDLSSLPLDGVRAEVSRSLDDVVSALGQGEGPRHFSYPYGRIDQSGGAVIRELGPPTAAVTEPAGCITAGSDPHALPRLGAHLPLLLLSARSSGRSPFFTRAQPTPAAPTLPVMITDDKEPTR